MPKTTRVGIAMRAAKVLVFIFAVFAAACLVPAALAQSADEEPVLMLGNTFPDFIGDAIPDLALFRYDAMGGTFVPIPFQIDERITDRLFNSGTEYEFTETVYDVFGEDDGLLDADDELAFMFGDAGPQAPAAAPGVTGADDERYEIHVYDPRTGAPDPDRYVYLFHGSSLPLSPTDYVSWTVSPTTAVTTADFTLEYTGNWLLTGLRVFSPCGTGVDLIDRFKGRAGTGPQSETEQLWNSYSTFLGGLIGPIRAIRYVQGAASGVNTVHHDIVYRDYWERHINLRVHPITPVWSYFDWLPNSNAVIYLPGDPGGLIVDGSPDTLSSTAIPDWMLYRSAAGGMVFLPDLPASPYYSSAELDYVDDASYDDGPIGYGDDDDSAYGDVEVVMNDVHPGNSDAISYNLAGYPLCSDVGDATVASAYRQLVDEPLSETAAPQFAGIGLLSTLSLHRDGNDVVLDWQPLSGAASYRVYASDFPDLPKASWTVLGDTTALEYRDSGAALLPDVRYYSVLGIP